MTDGIGGGWGGGGQGFPLVRGIKVGRGWGGQCCSVGEGNEAGRGEGGGGGGGRSMESAGYRANGSQHLIGRDCQPMGVREE